MVASGIKTSIEDYHSRYAHSMPAPFDPYIVSYLTLESEPETKPYSTT